MTLAWHHFIEVWALIGLNILSPGPNVLNTISISMGSGRRAGLACSGAVGIGIALWAGGAVLGVAALFTLAPWLEPALELLGAGLLIWFAKRYLQRALGGRGQLRARGDISPRQAFSGSLAILATNPKALTTWLTVLAIFPVKAAMPADLALLVLGAILLAMGLHAAYALLFSTKVAAKAYMRAAPVIDCAVAVFFVMIAAGLVRHVVLQLA
ncbi:MAG: LysE family transporter [Paracoccaceae bacterium]